MSNQIGLIGDLAFNGLISNEPQYNIERYKHISPILISCDIVFANFEAPLQGNGEKNEYKTFIHFSKYDVAKEMLQFLNISCVSLANNHIYDCKMSGLKATINLLDESGISHTGAGWKKEHVEPVIILKNGFRFGFLAYVDKSTNPKTESFPELLINYFEPVKVIDDIHRLRNRVDKIICSVHWGVDYSNFFTKKQQDIARTLINEGIDIIMGHHPHTIQTYELYKGKTIFYSLGQLCYGDFIWEGNLRSLKRKTKLGIITIIDSNGDLKKIIPIRERKRNYIEIRHVNITRKLKVQAWINGLIQKNLLFKYLVIIKESFIDRLSEFCFGYYRNPFKEIVKLKNYRKVTYLIRDYKSRE